jgi:FkbM family methyltransferase
MFSIRTWLREKAPWRQPDLPFDRATLEDLHYCYRLLLKREPDEGGWEFMKYEILNNQLDLQALVDYFLYMAEFQELQEEAARPVLVELEDFRMFVRRNDFYIGAHIARDRFFEDHIGNELRRLLNPGDVFIDIGANIGYFTLLGASLVGSHGRVFAFEPLTDNCALMKKSVTENSFENVDINPVAIAESRQTFQLDVSGFSSNARVIDFTSEAVPGSGPKRLVEVFTLDEMMTTAERIDVIKMDIEGAEPRAWQGMQQTVTQHQPILIFEFSPNLIKVTSHVDPADFLGMVLKKDYDLFIIKAEGGLTDRALNPEQIIQRHTQTGLSHVDILAMPRM